MALKADYFMYTNSRVPKYNEHQTIQLVEKFSKLPQPATREDLENLASEIGRSFQSVVSKLAQLGLYKAKKGPPARPKLTKAQRINMLFTEEVVNRPLLENVQADVIKGFQSLMKLTSAEIDNLVALGLLNEPAATEDQTEAQTGFKF